MHFGLIGGFAEIDFIANGLLNAVCRPLAGHVTHDEGIARVECIRRGCRPEMKTGNGN
jgi:hypothetical protein